MTTFHVEIIEFSHPGVIQSKEIKTTESLSQALIWKKECERLGGKATITAQDPWYEDDYLPNYCIEPEE